MLNKLKSLFKKPVEDNFVSDFDGLLDSGPRKQDSHKTVPKLITVADWEVTFHCADGDFKRTFMGRAVPTPYAEEGYCLYPAEDSLMDFIRNWSMTGAAIFGKNCVLWTHLISVKVSATGRPVTVQAYVVENDGKADAEAAAYAHMNELNRQTAINRAQTRHWEA